MATKSNAQRYAYVLWDEILEELALSIPMSSRNDSTAMPC